MAASDAFSTNKAALGTPAEHVALVTPHDTNELSYVTRGISFKTAGDLKVVTVGGETVVIPSGALAAGVIHPLRVKQVYDTGTAAVSIVAYW
jgi:hypothetical protein